MFFNLGYNMKKILLAMFFILMTAAAPNTGSAELDKGLKEANSYLGSPINGELWRTTMQNELFWLTDLTLGDGKYTEVTINTEGKKLENVFVSIGTYEIIDAKDRFIHLNGISSKIKDLKGYTKIYIMKPDSSNMKSQGDEDWYSEDTEINTYLVKIKNNKMYMHSLAEENNKYFFNYTTELNDESAEVFEKQ